MKLKHKNLAYRHKVKMMREIEENQTSLTQDYGIRHPIRNKQTNEVVLMTEKQEKTGIPPVHKCRAGALEVSVWENEVKKEGKESYKTHNVTFKRGYKDKEGVWKDSQSLNVGDVPKLRELLREAYSWIISQKKEVQE